MHIHHPPQSKGDNYHVVALTSTTLGSLKLDSSISNQQIGNANHNDAQNGELNDLAKYGNGNISDSKDKRKDFSVELIEAKTWSNMIEEKIPKVIPRTPVRTPPGEPETINTWELMEGLEDASPFRSPNHFRSFSFDVARDSVHTLKSKLQERSHFRSCPPDHQFYFRPLDNEKEHCDAGKEFSFDTPNAEKIIGEIMDFKCPPYKKDKVVLYFTSLRGVRKTYEHCCHVRVILKSLGVRVDERDVSMHSGFKEELKELLGDGFNGGGLPRVFVGRNYIGGAEEIWRLHEDGKLEKLLCCEKVDDGSGGGGNVSEVCEACGDIRFVPCETCSGSCKIYYEADEEEEEEEEVVEGEEIEYGFQRCPDCNENGLIRCPICCY
ncbi:putative Glutaredoxin family protein [Quillaja saponaria]|uniref:Glutaredoxin family protein n=1 Tax=Quillaja saponaria TaxID=32244 RepID=A0AAD7Q3Z2_QUISA|nr:putative Glutaredoxin family protein [Quillaja saponaria]